MQQPVGVMQPHWQQALAAPLAWSAIAQETRVALVAALLPLLALALLAWQPCRGATRSARRECAPLPSGSCKAQAAALLPPQPSPQPRLSESADDILVNARASSCSASNVGITAAAAPAPPLLSAAAAGMPLTAPVTGAAAAGPGLERLMCQLQAMCPTNQSHPGSAALYTRNVRHVGVHVKLFEHHSPATSSGTAAAASSDAVYMEQAAHAHAVVRHALHQLPQQWQVLMMATFPGWVHVSAQLVLQGEAAAAEAAAAAVAAAVEAVLPPEGAAASAAAAPSVATLPLEQQAAAMRGLWWEPAALPAGPTPSMVNVTLPHQLVSGVERTRCGLRAVVCDAAAQAAGEVTPLIDHTQWPGDAWWPAGGAPLLLQIPGSAAGSQLLLLHLLRAAPAAAAAAGDENGGGGGVGALLATVPLLVLPQAACDELELLRAAVLCRWRIQHPGATQAQAVAAVACSQMQFAYDYAMLLHRGVAGQGHALSQEVLAYLACNQLAACLQLLDDGDSPLAVQAQQPISRGRSGAAPSSPQETQPATGSTCARRAATRSNDATSAPPPVQQQRQLVQRLRHALPALLAGFEDPQEEAAFGFWKAQQIQDVWALVAHAIAFLVPATAISWYAIAFGESGAHAVLLGVYLQALISAAPLIAYLASSRAFFLRWRGMVWALGMLAGGLMPVFSVHCLATPQLWRQLGGTLYQRPLCSGLILHVVMPFVQQLSPGEQALATLGALLATHTVASLSSRGPYPAAVYAALVAASLLIACVLDARLRRQWQQAQRPRAAATAAGMQRVLGAAAHGSTTTVNAAKAHAE